MLAHGVKLRPVPIQSLSEMERARLQGVACCHLEERGLDFKISIPQATRKTRKSLRKRFDSFSKERKEREVPPKAFGIPLAQVIANDRVHKQRQDALKESRRDCRELEASVLHFRAKMQAQHGSGLPWHGSTSPAVGLFQEACGKPLSVPIQDSSSRAQRRGGLSVDCISDLVESQSRLLEALQLSHPYELDGKRATDRAQTKLSLNPIYRQVPRVVELCCRHIEAHGLQTVGIFRVGSSKKRVRQLREDFDLGVDVILDEEHSAHDVAALLKEFLRDTPDPLLSRELYTAFLHASTLQGTEQLHYLQLLLFLLPPCNCDTLLRLLTLLHTVHCHAQDTVDSNGQEIPGNKMTAANLAVIFGPNLLQKERGSEKDLSQQSVGMEDSAAIISVTLQLIQNYRQLFMVSVELQQEVLTQLIQTDPDILVYLLRRKLSMGYPVTNDDARGHQATKEPPESMELSNGDLELTITHFPGPQEEVNLSSEAIFNALRHKWIQKYQSTVTSGKSIARTRQFHSHHNLLSLARPSSRLFCEDREEAGPVAQRTVHFSLGEDLRASQTPSPKDLGVLWVKDSKTQVANFWDFFTRKTPSSTTALRSGRVRSDPVTPHYGDTCTHSYTNNHKYTSNI